MSLTEALGILLTIFFGVPSIISLLQSFPSRITFLIDDNINLYYNVSKSIPGLDIIYNGNKVNKTSYLTKACFVYKGRRDILNVQVTKPITLKLPNGSTIYNYNIISCSEDLTVKMNVIEDKVIFDFDLLKNEDYVYFQIFADLGSLSEEQFTLTHRIENVKKIKKLRLIDFTTPILVWVVFAFMIMCFMVPLLSIVVGGMNSLDLYSDKDLAVTYYENNRIISIDSVTNVYSYNINRMNEYVKEISKTGQSLDSNEIKSMRDYSNSFKNFEQVPGKLELVFNKDVKKDYKIFDFINNTDTKRYKLNDTYSVVYHIKSGKEIYGMSMLFIFGLFMLILISNYGIDQYRYNALVKSIDKIKRETNYSD